MLKPEAISADIENLQRLIKIRDILRQFIDVRVETGEENKKNKERIKKEIEEYANKNYFSTERIYRYEVTVHDVLDTNSYGFLKNNIANWETLYNEFLSLLSAKEKEDIGNFCRIAPPVHMKLASEYLKSIYGNFFMEQYKAVEYFMENMLQKATETSILYHCIRNGQIDDFNSILNTYSIESLVSILHDNRNNTFLGPYYSKMQVSEGEVEILEIVIKNLSQEEIKSLLECRNGGFSHHAHQEAPLFSILERHLLKENIEEIKKQEDTFKI